MLVGYHGAALDLGFWLARGGTMLEIYPKGSTHTPLYAAKVGVCDVVQCVGGGLGTRCTPAPAAHLRSTLPT